MFFTFSVILIRYSYGKVVKITNTLGLIIAYSRSAFIDLLYNLFSYL